MKKNAIIIVAALLFLAAPFATAHAYSNYFTGTGSFTATYPTSPLVSYGCMLCHTTASGGSRNSYGTAYANGGHVFNATLANADSDGDGFTNLQEITAGTYPGTASSRPTDTTPPIVTFAVPLTSSSLTVVFTTFNTNDATAGVAYLVNESSTPPPASGAGWSTTKPTSYTAASAGTHVIYAWAKDASGNVSAAKSGSVTITLPDTTPPIVTFAVPLTSSSLTVVFTTFNTNDATAGVAYLVNESSTPPPASGAGWSTTKPTSYTAASAGTHVIYAWAKDASGNVSAAKSGSVTITLPDTTPPIVTFAVPLTSSSLNVNFTTFTTDDVSAGINYLVNESSTPPAASAAGWSATKPASYTAASAGTHVIYAWAKDAAGNVSAAKSGSVTITLPDTTPPIVTFAVPLTSSSLNVNFTTFTTDDVSAGINYLVNESSTPPAASAAGWSATKPASYTAASAGTHVIYAWAKDAAGNVSAAKSGSVTITLVDTSAPTVTGFTIPASSGSLTVSITTFTATDAGGAVTGFIVTESATAPATTAAGWSTTKPASYTFTTAGPKTLFGYAKDGAGNISVPLSAATTITIVDTVAPVVTAFVVPTSSSSLTVPITSCDATDNVAVTGHLITESLTPPAVSDPGWSATPHMSYTFASASTHVLYAWAKDAAGNVSASVSRTIVLTLSDAAPPAVTNFSIPSASPSLTVAIDAFTATDNVAVTGYIVTETATKPNVSAAGWRNTRPTSYTCSSGGNKTLYAWAKDAAGNISAARRDTVAIATSDTRAPVVTKFEVDRASEKPTVKVSLSARDNVGVTGYLLKEGGGRPEASASGWKSTAPTSYTFTSGGTKTLSAWAKDGAGNISARVLRSVVIRWSGNIPDDDDDEHEDD